MNEFSKRLYSLSLFPAQAKCTHNKKRILCMTLNSIGW